MKKKKTKQQKRVCYICGKVVNKENKGFCRFIGKKRINLHYGECAKKHLDFGPFKNSIDLRGVLNK